MSGKRFAAIYVVEQEPKWRSFALTALSVLGYAVEASSDSNQFLRRINFTSPSLTILGFSRIGSKELEVIARLSRDQRTGSVVVVASTLSDQSIRQAFLHGASDVALKSFEERTLLDIVYDQQQAVDLQSSYAIMRARSLVNG